MLRNFSHSFRWGVYAGSVYLLIVIAGLLLEKRCLWNTSPENLACVLYLAPIFPGFPLVSILQEWGFLSKDDTLVLLTSLLTSIIEAFLLGAITGWVIGKFKKRFDPLE